MGSCYDIMAFHFSRSSHFSAKCTERCHNVCATNVRTRPHMKCARQCVLHAYTHLHNFTRRTCDTKIRRHFTFFCCCCFFIQFFFRGSNASLELRNYHKVRLFWRRVYGTVVALHSRNVIKVIIDKQKMASFWQSGELFFVWKTHAAHADSRAVCSDIQLSDRRPPLSPFLRSYIACLFIKWCVWRTLFIFSSLSAAEKAKCVESERILCHAKKISPETTEQLRFHSQNQNNNIDSERYTHVFSIHFILYACAVCICLNRRKTMTQLVVDKRRNVFHLHRKQ